MNLTNQNGMTSSKSCDLSIRQCKKKSDSRFGIIRKQTQITEATLS